MKICPVCVDVVTNWAVATGKAVQINGILYHLKCVEESSTKAVAEGKWEPIKSP